MPIRWLRTEDSWIASGWGLVAKNANHVIRRLEISAPPSWLLGRVDGLEAESSLTAKGLKNHVYIIQDCRQILYHLNHQRSPFRMVISSNADYYLSPLFPIFLQSKPFFPKLFPYTNMLDHYSWSTNRSFSICSFCACIFHENLLTDTAIYSCWIFTNLYVL